jgi:hypothetical protein
MSHPVTARPELLDYIVFFETEPIWVSPEGWYHGMRFEIQRGEDRVLATLAPEEGEFAVAWWQGERLRLRMNAVQLSGWEIDTKDGRELLRVRPLQDHLKFCELQLRPHVRVEWATEWS